MNDFKVWLSIGGLALLLIGHLVYTTVCPLLPAKMQFACVLASDLAQVAGQAAEDDSTLDSGVAP